MNKPEKVDENTLFAIASNSKAFTTASLVLKDYAGNYTDQLYGDATISEENGKLVLRFVQSPNFAADLEH